MPPEGSLTTAQHEILEAVWSGGRRGLSVAEIWRHVAARRKVGRTTVLNLVDRLEKRGWLRRRLDEGHGIRYTAAIGRERTANRLAKEFVDDYFGGSAADLVMSLLGSKKLGADELENLRAVLREHDERYPEEGSSNETNR